MPEKKQTSKSTKNRNNRERGKAFEIKMEKYLGWFRVPYSGSAEVFGRGDVRDDEAQSRTFAMGECKSMTPRSTTEVNYILQEKWLVGDDSIMARARRAGNKLGALFFTKVRSPLTFAVIKIEHFRMFMQMVDILRQQGIISDTTDVEILREEVDSLHGEINNK